MVVQYGDIIETMHLPQNGPFNLGTGLILVVHDPVLGVAAFPAQIKLPLGVAVKASTPIEQFFEPVGAFTHHHPNHRFVAKPVAANQRIVYVLVIRIHRAIGNNGNPALRITCIGFGFAGFGHDGHLFVGKRVASLMARVSPATPEPIIR
jgi:hypothetical protein